MAGNDGGGFCAQCGQARADGASFCQACGAGATETLPVATAPLVAATAPLVAPEPRTSSRMALVLVAVLAPLIVAAFVGGWWWQTHQSPAAAPAAAVTPAAGATSSVLPAPPTAAAPVATSTPAAATTSAPVPAAPAPVPAAPVAPAPGAPGCATTSARQAAAAALPKVPRFGDGDGWDWVLLEHELSNYDPCADLSWVVLGIPGPTGSSPYQIMLFHRGEFLGTTFKNARGFYPTVTRLSGSAIRVQYRYRVGNEGTANASGVAISTFTWSASAQRVIHAGQIPPER